MLAFAGPSHNCLPRPEGSNPGFETGPCAAFATKSSRVGGMVVGGSNIRIDAMHDERSVLRSPGTGTVAVTLQLGSRTGKKSQGLLDSRSADARRQLELLRKLEKAIAQINGEEWKEPQGWNQLVPRYVSSSGSLPHGTRESETVSSRGVGTISPPVSRKQSIAVINSPSNDIPDLGCGACPSGGDPPSSYTLMKSSSMCSRDRPKIVFELKAVSAVWEKDFEASERVSPVKDFYQPRWSEAKARVSAPTLQIDVTDEHVETSFWTYGVFPNKEKVMWENNESHGRTEMERTRTGWIRRSSWSGSSKRTLVESYSISEDGRRLVVTSTVRSGLATPTSVRNVYTRKVRRGWLPFL